ncbi:sporozoite surface antigen MB2, putative [Plasmodium relictum]|uniref:Translation initiation factor IF-2, chloroplastic n=1 Tax=Plasmodium relictum TaxID=85471 RepID=A0A1J1H759_PLARL|nr:sporozoite surface antigen MB2, putative [Plasmodium relictum]CRH00499.1 sporozoite surface antigen MB2, putative [Plasmodium relictum]
MFLKLLNVFVSLIIYVTITQINICLSFNLRKKLFFNLCKDRKCTKESTIKYNFILNKFFIKDVKSYLHKTKTGNPLLDSHFQYDLNMRILVNTIYKRNKKKNYIQLYNDYKNGYISSNLNNNAVKNINCTSNENENKNKKNNNLNNKYNSNNFEKNNHIIKKDIYNDVINKKVKNHEILYKRINDLKIKSNKEKEIESHNKNSNDIQQVMNLKIYSNKEDNKNVNSNHLNNINSNDRIQHNYIYSHNYNNNNSNGIMKYAYDNSKSTRSNNINDKKHNPSNIHYKNYSSNIKLDSLYINKNKTNTKKIDKNLISNENHIKEETLKNEKSKDFKLYDENMGKTFEGYVHSVSKNAACIKISELNKYGLLFKNKANLGDDIDDMNNFFEVNQKVYVKILGISIRKKIYYLGNVIKYNENIKLKKGEYSKGLITKICDSYCFIKILKNGSSGYLHKSKLFISNMDNNLESLSDLIVSKEDKIIFNKNNLIKFHFTEIFKIWDIIDVEILGESNDAFKSNYVLTIPQKSETYKKIRNFLNLIDSKENKYNNDDNNNNNSLKDKNIYINELKEINSFFNDKKKNTRKKNKLNDQKEYQQTKKQDYLKKNRESFDKLSKSTKHYQLPENITLSLLSKTIKISLSSIKKFFVINENKEFNSNYKLNNEQLKKVCEYFNINYNIEVKSYFNDIRDKPDNNYNGKSTFHEIKDSKDKMYIRQINKNEIHKNKIDKNKNDNIIVDKKEKDEKNENKITVDKKEKNEKSEDKIIVDKKEKDEKSEDKITVDKKEKDEKNENKITVDKKEKDENKNCEISIDKKKKKKKKNLTDLLSKRENYLKESNKDNSLIKKRNVVVTFIGHINHGKTSLFDYICKTNERNKEHGLITQNIRAFKAKVRDEYTFTFIDTPGHEAFMPIRSRGVKISDLSILVISGEEGIQEQTVECIKLIKEFNIKIIIAITKVDLPNIYIDRILNDLLEYGITTELNGGEIQVVECSIFKDDSVNKLLDAISLESEFFNLEMNTNEQASGVILDSYIDKIGIVSINILQSGILKVNDYFYTGSSYGRIKILKDHLNKNIKCAYSSDPIKVIGYNKNSLPKAGDKFFVVENESIAKEIAEHNKNKILSIEMNNFSYGGENLDIYKNFVISNENPNNTIISMDENINKEEDDISSKNINNNEHTDSNEKNAILNSEMDNLNKNKHKLNNFSDDAANSLENDILNNNDKSLFQNSLKKIYVNYFIKCDKQGTIDVLKNSILKLEKEDTIYKVKNKIIYANIGDITSSDINYALSFNAVIIGFNVKMSRNVPKNSKNYNYNVLFSNVLYELIKKVEEEMEKRLSAKPNGHLIGTAKILKVFNISKLGKVAGCAVTSGNINNNSSVRILRNDKIIYIGKVISLKIVKEEKTQVSENDECGIGFENFIDFLPDDIIEAYEE